METLTRPTRNDTADHFSVENPRYQWMDNGPFVEFCIGLEDAQSGSHQGRCDEDIEALMQKDYIKAQFDVIPMEALIQELLECGAWDRKELESDEDSTRERFLWVSCNNISEEE